MDKKNRVIYLDVLKIIACFFVVINHTVSKIFYTVVTKEILFISVFYFFISKMAVPIFIMVTGYLILSRNISLEDLFKKYIFRMVIVLILFSFFVYILDSRQGIYKFGILNFFTEIIKYPIHTSYWYLYTLIGLYLSSPFIKKIITDLDENHYKLFFVLWILFTSLLPTLQSTSNIKVTGFLNIPIVFGYIGYFIAGYYFSIKEIKIKYLNIICILLILLSIGGVTFLTLKEYYANKEFLLSLDNVNFIFFTVSSVSFFILIKNIFSKVNFNERIIKIINYLSKSTFGIYLTHTILINYFFEGIRLRIINIFGNLLGIIFFQIGIFISSLIITRILLKIPILKKYI